MRKRWLGFAAAAIAALASLWFWNSLPEQVPTHWNARGVADGYSSRAVAALMLPAIMAAFTALMQVVHLIDPRGHNYERFRDVFWLLVNAVLLFFLVVHVAVLAAATGGAVNMPRVVAAGMGVVLAVLGNYLGRVRPNWFVGIRTPWTLESAEVWRRTHRVGGRMFVVAGVVTFAAALLPGAHAFTVGFVSVMVAGLGSALLSLVFWLQEKRRTGGAGGDT